VRRRLVLAIAGVAATAVVLFAVPLAVVLDRSARDRELLRLQRDTIALTRSVDLGAAGSDPVELPRSSDALAVYDRAGRRVSGRGPARAGAVVANALGTGHPADAVTGGRLVVAVPLLSAERVTGAVRAERSDAAAVAVAHRLWLWLLLSAGALVGLAALAAVILARRLVAPLERLAGAAGRLGDGDFTTRAPRAGVSELDAVADALDATAARLGDLLDRERAFSADASHQLRTPLAALRLELEAIELRGDAPAGLAEALAQVDRLQATIDTLLAVARDAPRRDTTTDLTALADELEARWRGPLARENRPLRMLVSVSAPVVRASSPILDEVFDVLLGNALRHGAGAVSVTVREAAGSTAIDISDEGAGFDGDPELAFRRRAGAGHGIGLALARSLVQAEDGQLLVTRGRPYPVLTVLLRRA
jgi:signal transduction histidine kinase